MVGAATASNDTAAAEIAVPGLARHVRTLPAPSNSKASGAEASRWTAAPGTSAGASPPGRPWSVTAPSWRERYDSPPGELRMSSVPAVAVFTWRRPLPLYWRFTSKSPSPKGCSSAAVAPVGTRKPMRPESFTRLTVEVHAASERSCMTEQAPCCQADGMAQAPR